MVKNHLRDFYSIPVIPGRRSCPVGLMGGGGRGGGGIEKHTVRTPGPCIKIQYSSVTSTQWLCVGIKDTTAKIDPPDTVQCTLTLWRVVPERFCGRLRAQEMTAKWQYLDNPSPANSAGSSNIRVIQDGGSFLFLPSFGGKILWRKGSRLGNFRTAQSLWNNIKDGRKKSINFYGAGCSCGLCRYR